MKMNKKTLKALHESIDHWFDILEEKTIDTTAGACALCKRFPHTCMTWDEEKCPVFKKTERTFCERSPYSRYIRARTPRNARKEVEFLISLLPVKEQRPYWYDD